MSRFFIEATPLAGLKRIRRVPVEDSRGWFERLYCRNELAVAAGHPFMPEQINRSFTGARGAVRGLHFQHPPHGEIKLVSCLRGEVYDVAVDLRIGSPTFLNWYGTTLSADNHCSLLIPQGFAHGFQTLCEDCELLYLHSTAYVPEAEGRIHPNEVRVGIAWPLPVQDLSVRDATQLPLGSDFVGISAVSYNPDQSPV